MQYAEHQPKRSKLLSSMQHFSPFQMLACNMIARTPVERTPSILQLHLQ